ncbi:MAG: SMP-30/gluconolactonase/LRE family protein [Beutenbergiaceae bacterium]
MSAHSLLAPGAELELLADGSVWAEGPVWLPQRRRVRWSDIPNNRILEWDAVSGQTSVYDRAAEYANGRTLDRDGHVVQCSHGRRRVEREIDGELHCVVDRWAGGRFNSPNDVAVSRDGSIWFTDPPYGILPETREGYPAASEYGGCYVFRFDEAGGATPVITDMVHPNGLAFSPDQQWLYIADTGAGMGLTAFNGIRRYPVRDGACGAGEDFVQVYPDQPDGFRIDVEGRIWTSSGDSVQVFSDAGEQLLRVPTGARVSNLCFGGDSGTDLFLTVTDRVYRLRTTTTDAAFAQPGPCSA